MSGKFPCFVQWNDGLLITIKILDILEFEIVFFKPYVFHVIFLTRFLTMIDFLNHLQ